MKHNFFVVECGMKLFLYFFSFAHTLCFFLHFPQVQVNQSAWGQAAGRGLWHNPTWASALLNPVEEYLVGRVP